MRVEHVGGNGSTRRHPGRVPEYGGRHLSSIRRTWTAPGSTLRQSPGLGRLAAVRFAGLLGDGMFQAALGGAILFSPDRENGLDVAGAPAALSEMVAERQ